MLSKKSQSFLVKPVNGSPLRTKSMYLGGSPGVAGGSPQQYATQEANIQVVVRCRPLSVEEKRQDVTAAVLCNSEKSTITVNHALIGGSKKVARTWEFDKVYGMYSTQLQIFHESVKPIVQVSAALCAVSVLCAGRVLPVCTYHVHVLSCVCP